MGHKLRSRDGATAAVRSEKAHFVNNELFMEKLVERQAINKEREEQGLEPVVISRYLSECMYKIADALSKRHNFIGYSFREDMVADAVLDCVRYIDKWTRDKGDNPFAYFNQISFYAFLRYIQKEKDQSYVKYKVVSNLGTILQDIGVEAHDHDEDYKNHVTELLQLQDNKALDEAYQKRDKREKDLREKKKLDFDLAKGEVDMTISIDDFCEVDVPL
jgi:hypothetical protein